MSDPKQLEYLGRIADALEACASFLLMYLQKQIPDIMEEKEPDASLPEEHLPQKYLDRF